MSWKKYFKPTNSVLPIQGGSERMSGKMSNFNNWLPELYQGPPDRLHRYAVYEAMDSDNDIHSALNIITDFSTETDEITQLPFIINYTSDPTPTEIRIIERTLSQWVALNDFKKRLWPMVRGVLKYGDQLFIRDPETYKLFWCDIAKVSEAIVNELNGKKIEGYHIKDIDLNLHSLVATTSGTQGTLMNNNGVIFSPPINTNFNVSSSYVSSGQGVSSQTDTPVNSSHIVHLTLSDGMNQGWPFGQSILESVFKTFKQRELLEDSILIYRVHRAPERRVFFIDVGTLPPNKANAYLERMKYEVQQKRIPSKNGGGASITDSGYSPMSMLEDYFFASSCLTLDTKVPLLDGRVLTLEDLIAEYNAGNENFTYTVNQKTFEMEPGKIVWAGVTRKDASLVEVTLDNGEIIRATPDHRFIMRDGSEIEAGKLKANDSLMPLYLDYAKTSDKQTEALYLRCVRILPYTEDTGDLTIESAGGWHNFATSAGVYVHNSDGRGSRVETLPGGDGLGSLEDLKYFSSKMFKALGIPSSYLPSNPDDSGGGFNDGRVGTAFIQEFTFSKICKRYQKQIIGPLDQEFKLYLKMKGVEVDNSMFELEMTPPQSFSEYRQMELDAAHINIFGAVADIPYIAKRFALKRYMGWTEGEIEENERLLTEERGKKKGASSSSGAGTASAGGADAMGGTELSDAGITSSGIDSMAPADGFDETQPEGETEDSGTDTSQNSEADIDSFGEDENAK